MDINNKKTRLVIILELIIASFFIVGADWAGHNINLIFKSYFADMFLPFGFYFLLSIKGDHSKYFNSWWKKAVSVFALVATSETLQYFGFYALARVFDPVDYVMYAIGVMFAAFVDRKIFTKSFSFWN